MSYGDFFIRYEHKFLRNLYSKEQLNSSPEIKALKENAIKHFKNLLRFAQVYNQFLFQTLNLMIQTIMIMN